MSITIGTCSLCGGPVQTPEKTNTSVPPTPTCARCGAKKRSNYGQVIDMEPPPLKDWEPAYPYKND